MTREEADREISDAIRKHADYHAAPASLVSEVLSALPAEEAAPPRPRWQRWLVQAAHLSLSRLLKPKYVVHPDVALTPREIEVLKWSADGKTAAEIGDILSISIPTVNFHIKNAVQKMKAANKTSAVVQALMAGLLN